MYGAEIESSSNGSLSLVCKKSKSIFSACENVYLKNYTQVDEKANDRINFVGPFFSGRFDKYPHFYLAVECQIADSKDFADIGVYFTAN